MTALDSDQSSYKQSEEEDTEPESDVEDVEFSGMGMGHVQPQQSLLLL